MITLINFNLQQSLLPRISNKQNEGYNCRRKYIKFTKTKCERSLAHLGLDYLQMDIIYNTFIGLGHVTYAVVGFRKTTGSVGTAFPSSAACSLQENKSKVTYRKTRLQINNNNNNNKIQHFYSAIFTGCSMAIDHAVQSMESSFAQHDRSIAPNSLKTINNQLFKISDFNLSVFKFRD